MVSIGTGERQWFNYFAVCLVSVIFLTAVFTFEEKAVEKEPALKGEPLTPTDFPNNDEIQEGEIFAHNPSITGVKLEDSILIQGDQYEILTLSDSWPSSEVEYEETILKRPDIPIR